MSGPSIRVTRDFYAIRVFINDLLHLYVPAMGPVGLHSWVKPVHSIELQWPGGSMTSEYDSREKWELVLSGLRGALDGEHPPTEARGYRQQCKGKVKHATEGIASVELLKNHGPNGGFNVYLCPHCKGWHVGHKDAE